MVEYRVPSSSSENSTPAVTESVRSITPARYVENPRPMTPGAWPLSLESALTATRPASGQDIQGTPNPPVAYPPVSPYPNRIASAPKVANDVQISRGRFGINTRLQSRKQYRPFGEPYKPSHQLLKAPMGAPTGPQRAGIERSWVTWWWDGSTQNHIPALATEMVGSADEIDWNEVMFFMHITNHRHLVKMLDASHLPKRDYSTGKFVRLDGGFVEKSLTDISNLAGRTEREWKRKRRDWREQKHVQWRQCGHFSGANDITPGCVQYPFLVLEYVDGQPLSMILQKRPDGMEECFLWYFLIAMLDAVRWLHHGRPHRLRVGDGEWKSVIHNNINPDNIWLNRPWKQKLKWGTLKLGNFSRAIVLGGEATGSLNSPVNENRFCPIGYKRKPQHEHFEAPELSWLVDTDPARGVLEKDSDPRPAADSTRCRPIGGRSDIWSIGAVAVALMGGIWIDPQDTPLARWATISREESFVLQTYQLYKLGGKRWDIALLPSAYSLAFRGVLEKLLTLDPRTRLDANEAYVLAMKQHRIWSATQAGRQNIDQSDDAVDSDVGDDDVPLGDNRPRESRGGSSTRRPSPGSRVSSPSPSQAAKHAHNGSSSPSGDLVRVDGGFQRADHPRSPFNAQSPTVTRRTSPKTAPQQSPTLGDIRAAQAASKAQTAQQRRSPSVNDTTFNSFGIAKHGHGTTAQHSKPPSSRTRLALSKSAQISLPFAARTPKDQRWKQGDKIIFGTTGHAMDGDPADDGDESDLSLPDEELNKNPCVLQ